MSTSLKYPTTKNCVQRTLAAELLQGVTAAMTLNNVVGVQNKAGLCVVDRIDSNSIVTPLKREYITFTGTSGNTLVGLTRNADGGVSDQDHAEGAIVEFVSDVLQQQAILDALGLMVTTAGALDTTKVVDLNTAQSLTNKNISFTKLSKVTGGMMIELNPGTATNDAGIYNGFYHNDLLFGSYIDGGYPQHFISFGFPADPSRKFHIGSASSSTFTTATFVPFATFKSDGKLGLACTSPVEQLTIGTAGTTAGTLSLAGATSGKAILAVSAAAGTPTLTLPTATGTLATLAGTEALTNKTIGTTNLISFNSPEGFLINGKIVPSVSSNNLIVAIKGLDGNDPSATNPVYCRIGDSVLSITSALSITANAGTDWLDMGNAQIATKEVDLFVYLWPGATVQMAISRLPHATIFSDLTNNTTNEKGFLRSTDTGLDAADPFENIGRFAATLSAGGGYTWSVPTFTSANLIQRPIYETRVLTHQPTLTGTGFSIGTSTYLGNYQIVMNRISTQAKITLAGITAGTSRDWTVKLPFTVSAAAFHFMPATMHVLDSTTADYCFTSSISHSETYLSIYNDWAGVLRNLGYDYPITFVNNDVIEWYADYLI